MTSQPTDDALTDIWRRERRRLMDVAFRMLGDVGEAEDIVQEAFIRLTQADLASIEDVRGWLIVVTSRLCLDYLRSARVRRESAIDSPLLEQGERASTSGIDPADRVTLDDSVRMALLSVLELLSPAERTSFVLHDVFQLPFETIAGIVGRSPAASRQLASRARRRVQAEAGAVRVDVEPATHRVAVERFINAAAGGDLSALMEVLDPDVAGDGTPGGLLPPFKPQVGRRAVARNALIFLGPKSGNTLVSLFIHDHPAILVTRDGAIVIVLLLDIRDGLVTHIHGVGDPAGLAQAAD
jgi:RNA polymerase sigma-70 factor (ECF subfamily)